MAEQMSDIGINLLKGKRAESRQRKAFLARVQVITGVVLAVYVGVLVVASVVRTGVGVQLENIEEKIEDEELSLAQLKPVETTHNLVVNKYSLFDEAYESRLAVDDKIEELVALLPEGVQINKVVLSDESEAIDVNVIAASMFEAQEVLTLIEQLVSDGEYEVVGMKSIARIETGEYTFSILLGQTAITTG